MKSFCIWIAVIGLLIWAASWLSSGIAPTIGEGLVWLSSRWWGSEWVAPYFTFFSIFLAVRLLCSPFLLSHSRVDHTKGEVKRRFESNDELKAWVFWPPVLVAVIDGVILFLMTSASTAQSGVRLTGNNVLVWANSGVLGKLLLMSVLLIGDLIVSAIVFTLIHSLCKRPLGITTASALPGSLFEFRTVFNSWLLVLIGDSVYIPAFIVLALVHGDNAMLLTMIFCFMITKVAAAGIFEFVSLLLDTINNRWLRKRAS